MIQKKTLIGIFSNFFFIFRSVTRRVCKASLRLLVRLMPLLYRFRNTTFSSMNAHTYISLRHSLNADRCPLDLANGICRSPSHFPSDVNRVRSRRAFVLEPYANTSCLFTPRTWLILTWLRGVNDDVKYKKKKMSSSINAPVKTVYFFFRVSTNRILLHDT